MLVGYARVSTTDQTLDLQHDALTKAGCTRIFTDTASGAQTERKGLTEALSFVRPGDTLVVWKLDRLGRSLKDLITRITELNDRKIGFKSLTEQIDTTTSGGKLIFHILGHWRSSSGISLRSGQTQGWKQQEPEESVEDGQKRCLRRRSNWRENSMRIQVRLSLRSVTCWGFHGIRCSGM
jgi:DNA invertase Pin-like site-specific DNA recombinase